MNDGPEKFHTGYLVEGLELLIRKVAYTKYDATWLVPWSNYIKRTMFLRQRFLRTDPKENISRLLLAGRCLATDPRKERFTSSLGLCHRDGPKKN
jgi:hypothetical protein